MSTPSVEEDLGLHLTHCGVAVFRGDQFAGSGVVAGPGVVLTCAHVVVVDSSGGGGELVVMHQGVRYSATVRHATLRTDSSGRVPDPYPWPDLAWLDVPGFAPEVWVEVDRLPPRAGDVLVGRGFSEVLERGVPSGHPARYRVEGPVPRPDGERWQLTDAQASPGMSGTPLINVRTGRLAGLLTRTRDRDTSLGGWAVHTHAGLVTDESFDQLFETIGEATVFVFYRL